MLRGICAIAVAYYHILSWTKVADLVSWGRYGVYIFFVLSGASMYLAYNRKFANGYPAEKFIALRFARIAPLYALVTIATILPAVVGARLSAQAAGLSLLNVSLLFGLGNPGVTSQVVGGWSLGVEFLFYLMFPVLLAVMNTRAWLAVLVLSFVVQHVSINVLSTSESYLYMQMLSFIFYFVAGCCIGRIINGGRVAKSQWWLVMFLLIMLPLAVVNTKDNLTGITGMILSLCAAAAVLSSSGIGISGMGSAIADYLGRMSYGLYLIHPILYFGGIRLAPGLGESPVLFATLIVVASGVLALAVETNFEVPIRRWMQKRLGV